MATAVRTLTTGMPTWSAAQGATALDTVAQVLYVNIDGGTTWLAIEGLGRVIQDVDEIAKKLRQLIAFLVDTGFDDLEQFDEDYDRASEEADEQN